MSESSGGRSSSESVHLDEELSALLDGELAPDEVETVNAHLARCASCRADLESIRAVRAQLRGAPAVDPPFGFYERLERKRRSPWAVVAAAVAIAAACIVVVGFVIQPGPATRTPPVDALRAMTAGSQAPGGLTLHKVDHLEALPTHLAGLPRKSTFKAFVQGGDASVGVFGSSPDQNLVAYVVRGDVDWSKLKGGLRSPVEGLSGNPWQSIDPNAAPAIVVQSGDNTVLVTGNVSQSTLQQAAKEIGDPQSPSAIDRLRDAVSTVVDGFSLS
ncbi:MAG TPA: zf-HC2 domain-containing protein [Acidimicrobiales bacterium]